jgi:hypothetical protein
MENDTCAPTICLRTNNRRGHLASAEKRMENDTVMPPPRRTPRRKPLNFLAATGLARVVLA